MQLPTVQLDNNEIYFVDRRLKQIRNVDNPHNFKDFVSEEELDNFIAAHRAPYGAEAGVIFLAGNLGDGFEAYGVFKDFDEACEVCDGMEGWVMEVKRPLPKTKV